MPELPEVETIRQDLRKKVVNLKIVDVVLSGKERIQGVSTDEFVDFLKNNNFIEIDRIGKLLIFVFNNNKYLLVHLKMTGQLIYQDEEKLIAGGHSDDMIIDVLPNKFTRISFVFDNNSKLFFNDMRRFGYMKIVEQEELDQVKSRFGIEPLQPDFTLENFKLALENRKTNIKALLLNQQVFSGIGNIYADEACFLSGIRPDRKASSLKNLELEKLHQSCESVIRKAIDERGTTFNNYLDSEGKRGNFLNFLKVYGRGGEKCLQCKKDVIQKIKVAGRGTAYCPNCQK